MCTLRIIYCFIIALGLISCKTNQFKNKQKHGCWIYCDTVDGKTYLTKAKYKNGIEKKTWKYYAGKNLIKKEKYNNGVCQVTTYHKNGAISSKGQTKLVVTDTVLHWYYFDDWYFFDPSGKQIAIKKYENGTLIQETEID